MQIKLTINQSINQYVSHVCMQLRALGKYQTEGISKRL